MSDTALSKASSGEIPLYEARKKIQPRAVTGVFANWRWALVFVTQIIFYGLPWLRWNGRQALLIISAYSLFLFTAIAGRLDRAQQPCYHFYAC